MYFRINLHSANIVHRIIIPEIRVIRDTAGMIKIRTFKGEKCLHLFKAETRIKLDAIRQNEISVTDAMQKVPRRS